MSTITHATQFHGLEDEDAPGHVSHFARICDTFNITAVSKDAIYLRLFSFSLSGHASTWLDTLPDNSITIWGDLKANRCPQHGLSDWAIVEKFYNGLTFEKHQMFNTAMGGHIMDRLEPSKCEDMFESFAQAEQQHPSTRTSNPSASSSTSSPRGLHQVTLDSRVAVALASKANEIKELKLRWRSGNNPPRFNSRQNQYGGGETGASSGSSVNTRKIEKMLENQTQLLAHLVQQDKDTRQSLDSHDTLLKNQQSTFQDLQRTVGDIAKSLKDRQEGPSSCSNASVMPVSVISQKEEEAIKEISHGTDRHIPSPEEVNKIDWRAHFAEIDAKMIEEQVDEDIVVEKLAEKAEEKKKGVEMKTP
ncbi:hypothetical protein L1987_02018 [Smallanthus sonchifolius]|uniref:Uncharacterized protein n=1 Tax=Smallanthus sonchifolius TaxID=185202 RepID=A0ACB9K6U2_9ASTR|nr:hypothetical protein L1987_02018 [Smallanthus sonchifolius]